MNDKFWIAWFGCKDYGEVSTIFTDRKACGKWLIQKFTEEDILTSNVEGFESKPEAEFYILNGKRRE